jgi:hypothetical protein
VSSGSKKPGKGSREAPEPKPAPEAESGTRPVEEETEVDVIWDSLLPPPPDEGDAADEVRPRGPMQTITNEVELEAARLRSIVTSSAPAPPAASPSSPQNRMSLLSLANNNAPTVPPPRQDPTELAGPSGHADARPAAPASDAVAPIVEMRERFSLGDYTGALQVAEAILEDSPDEDEARHCAEDCRAVLVKMYTARIGSLEKVPIVMVAKNQLRWLTIDHRAGFVLSHVDGSSTLEQILDVSGMPPLDALRILYELVQQRIIAFK